MKNYLSLIPISAKVRRRQNRMTLLCIIFAVFLVTAIFSMAEMVFRMETMHAKESHGNWHIWLMDIIDSENPIIMVFFLLILLAGILMISSSMNSNIAQRSQFFGMMRCIDMSRHQAIRFVRLEALNWCKTAIPAGLVLGTVISWA